MGFAEFWDFSNIHFILALFLSVANAIILVLVSKKFFQILQISGYKIRGYNVWLKDTKAKYVSRVTMLALLSLACVLVTNFLFDAYHQDYLFSYLGLIFYIYFAIAFVVGANKNPQKTPLVQTRRMSRLMTVMFLLAFVITFMLIWVSTVYLPFLRFGIMVVTPVLVPVLVPLVHFITIPLESLIRVTYIHRAKKKLEKFPNLIKIGITGSYGKTSVKYILNKMLAEKYNVCITPHSFNTPMGITKVVLNYLKKDHNLLIVEMGAKQVGDIKYLCDIVHPTHAIITSVGTQHYETFGSVENIAKTKFELVESLDKNAIAVFNVDSENLKPYFKNCKLENKIAVSLDGGEIQAKNIEIQTGGVKFDLCYQNKTQPCFCVLLGRHNVLNILLASAMALKLGVTLEQIASALEDLEPVSHRLELSNNGNITILDDAYSSNQEGAKCALEVLAEYKDCQKVCITPGIVELGEKEFEANKQFGKQMAQVCDFVIIVNKVNEEALKTGLKEENFDETHILSFENLDLAKNKIAEFNKQNQKYVLLFENDLPDNYT